MSTWEFTEASSWGDRPVARRISDVRPRGRLVVTGTIVAVGTVKVGRSESFSCEVDDGTGTMTVIFVGRTHLPGIEVGAKCTVEGTARVEKGGVAVWNPLYRLEPLAAQ
ncbi:MAG: single stranded DNA-binding domain-containing protein [Acidimicrobiales bacterium]|jgi:DNA/RNA endonuclease YhcR with UshA esterase domain